MDFLKHIFSSEEINLYNEAIGLFNRHNYLEAIVKFEMIMEIRTPRESPRLILSSFYLIQSHKNLGIIMFIIGNYSEALKEFSISMKRADQMYHKARINLLSVLKVLEKYEDAVQEGEYIQANNVGTLTFTASWPKYTS